MKASDLFLIGLAILGIYKIEKENARTQAASPVPDFDFDKIWEEVLEKSFKQPELISTNTIEIPLIQGPTALINPPDNTAIEASKWLAFIKHPEVIVILGKKGSGKSALAYRLLELLRWIAPIYVVGLPSTAHKYLRDWIEVQPELEDVPPNSIILLDESYIQYHARSSMTSQAKELSQILNLSRQRGQTLIFVSQESRQIDRNILSAADVVIFKEPGLLQTKFDRAELRGIVIQANQAFQSIIGDRKKWSFVYTQEQGCIGLMENSTPSFWSEKLSRAFASAGVSKARPAKKLTRAQRQAQAKEYEKMGFIPAQIARMMGLSKATIKNYLDDYPYKKKDKSGEG